MPADLIDRDPLDHETREAQRHSDELLAKQRKDLETADFRWLMKQPQGRRFAWRLLGEAGVYRSTFNSSGSITAFNEGKRQMGLWLMLQIHEHAPDALVAMLKESKPNA